MEEILAMAFVGAATNIGVVAFTVALAGDSLPAASTALM